MQDPDGDQHQRAMRQEDHADLGENLTCPGCRGISFAVMVPEAALC
ncbi:hypothetical protein [Enhydrobacter sp.]|nr:hypothetical protein [Enhydrobacter sp.]